MGIHKPKKRTAERITLKNFKDFVLDMIPPTFCNYNETN